ncbi:hypothetical protein CEK71_05990 [Methylovulum psychrotolerans]|uniref:Uncharacterized protein n=1 Tax=Methylovulum psychrotolerans TaxID=1704499 RepID=A0A1Z4BWH1_9GAMM|nr:hypothetical protein CEK71_05990 [Methylovulum psychrotolerans]
MAGIMAIRFGIGNLMLIGLGIGLLMVMATVHLMAMVIGHVIPTPNQFMCRDRCTIDPYNRRASVYFSR